MEIEQIIDTGFKSVETKLEAQLAASIEKYEGQVKESGKAATEVKAEVKALSEKFEAAMDQIAMKLNGVDVSQPAQLSAGAEFVKSEQYKQLLAVNTQRARLEVKNTIVSDGDTTFPFQKPGVITGDFAPLTIRQVLRSTPVT
jgi:hypothetical protein